VRSPHGTRVDEYYWLRDDERASKDGLAYLQAENDYKDAMLAQLAPLQRQLYEEIVGRIKQDDCSVRIASAATGTTGVLRRAGSIRCTPGAVTCRTRPNR
jgi:protease II